VRRTGGRSLGAVLALAVLTPSMAQAAANDEVRSVATRRGVTQGFLLVRPPGSPAAGVILFAGGDGRLGLSPNGIGQLRGNFLVRTRDRFARAGFLVALVDTPSDRADYWNFRTSSAHVEDVKQVIAALRAMAPVPVWVVGTSMGTLSAANAAARLAEGGPDGLVLTSTVTQTSRQSGESVRTVRLGEIRVPALIVLRRDDGCRASPPSDAPTVLKALTQSPRKEILTFEDGSPPRSEPCEAMAQHGFLGIETDVVEAIARWIRAPSPS
jgi:pimeloyl-ACP methyl ester carboxylesterase